MEADLHSVIRADILTKEHKKYIIYQILRAVKYMHSGDLIHRDLKPANILINKKCEIKICDFGLARTLKQPKPGFEQINTEYIATRWYRAPEVILGSNKYHKPVDMWSVGCIMGELILGKPIFPGSSTLNQIQKILELKGEKPNEEEITSMQSQLSRNILNSIKVQKFRDFKNFFPKGTSEDALRLLQKLLQFNPEKRIRAEGALKMEYVLEFSEVEQNPLEDVFQKNGNPAKIVTPLEDNEKFNAQKYMRALYNILQEKQDRIDRKRLAKIKNKKKKKK